MKSNGHDTSAARVNGHGPASLFHTAQDTEAPLENGRAASDDSRDFPAAAAASSAAAGMEHDECAEVARPAKSGASAGTGRKNSRTGRGTTRALSENSRNRDKNGSRDAEGSEESTMDIPPGSEPLPEDGPGFVDAMHAHVDLYLACARLVKSKDQKIAQRMVERLLEMSYGKSPAAPGDEAPQIIFDAPRPIRD